MLIPTMYRIFMYMGCSQREFQDPIDWRYLPYRRPIVQAYVREYTPQNMDLYDTVPPF